ncbi:hypothetical protein HELRODRAFT_190810 [Helobdella robusta]|uniref:C2H2-type domain-containing protein n=1 Tax=Helobdella robusta TaxID=6412 RepID=T1FSB1_HELRO|nr:hypothetical protein HELRODRAFT_190810 [Helobdella robusta]ESO07917.1 hypothetical protein HELRODRAFT_190810 [Helobdella robusta]
MARGIKALLSNCILVVNVTWRGKTYVGTLMDATKHHWASPRYTEESSFLELDWRSPKVRGGRNTNHSSSSNNDNIESLLTEGRRLRKCRRNNNGSSSNNNCNSNLRSQSTRQSPVFPEGLVTTSNRRKARTNAENTSQQQAQQNSVDRVDSDSPTLGKRSRDNCESSEQQMLECHEGVCNKKFKHATGLRYHQAHVHKKLPPVIVNGNVVEELKENTQPTTQDSKNNQFKKPQLVKNNSMDIDESKSRNDSPNVEMVCINASNSSTKLTITTTKILANAATTEATNNTTTTSSPVDSLNLFKPNSSVSNSSATDTTNASSTPFNISSGITTTSTTTTTTNTTTMSATTTQNETTALTTCSNNGQHQSTTVDVKVDNLAINFTSGPLSNSHSTASRNQIKSESQIKSEYEPVTPPSKHQKLHNDTSRPPSRVLHLISTPNSPIVIPGDNVNNSHHSTVKNERSTPSTPNIVHQPQKPFPINASQPNKHNSSSNKMTSSPLPATPMLPPMPQLPPGYPPFFGYGGIDPIYHMQLLGASPEYRMQFEHWMAEQQQQHQLLQRQQMLFNQYHNNSHAGLPQRQSTMSPKPVDMSVKSSPSSSSLFSDERSHKSNSVNKPSKHQQNNSNKRNNYHDSSSSSLSSAMIGIGEGVPDEKRKDAPSFKQERPTSRYHNASPASQKPQSSSSLSSSSSSQVPSSSYMSNFKDADMPAFPGNPFLASNLMKASTSSLSLPSSSLTSSSSSTSSSGYAFPPSFFHPSQFMDPTKYSSLNLSQPWVDGHSNKNRSISSNNNNNSSGNSDNLTNNNNSAKIVNNDNSNKNNNNNIGSNNNNSDPINKSTTPPSSSSSSSPLTLRHLHTHHHTHVLGPAYPLYASYNGERD